MGFGLDVSSIADNTVKLTTSELREYSGASEKTVSLIWYNKDENDKYLGFADGSFDDKAKSKDIIDWEGNTYYWIEWFVDNEKGELSPVETDGKSSSYQATMQRGLTETRVTAAVWCNGEKFTPLEAE